MARSVAALRPGGWLVVANQTAEELGELEQHLATHPMERLASASLASDLVPYAERTHERVGTLWLRR